MMIPFDPAALVVAVSVIVLIVILMYEFAFLDPIVVQMQLLKVIYKGQTSYGNHVYTLYLKNGQGLVQTTTLSSRGSLTRYYGERVNSTVFVTYYVGRLSGRSRISDVS